MKRLFFAFCSVAIMALVAPSTAVADIEEVVKAQERKKKKQVERFNRFTSDKNVMGEAKSPDGKKINAPEKQRFDSDGGKLLTYQSELTYHKNGFDILEEVEDKNASSGDSEKGKKVRKLYGFISEHGKDAGGDASALETGVYKLHEQFNQEEEQNKPKKEGVEFKSIFKVTTKKVQKQKASPQDQAGGGGGGGLEQAQDADEGNDDNEVEVARWEVRDEAVQEIERIGEQSFETVKQKAKDEENENDDQVMPNGILLRKAATQGLKAMAVEALAAISQRRTNRAIKDGALPERVQLSEGTPTCDAWAQNAAQLVSEAKTPEQREKRQEELDRMKEQCQEITNVSYKDIMPRYVQEEGQDSESLKSLGVNKEDARERDLRVQLNLLNEYGMSTNEVQNNWGYSREDIATPVAQHDENGNFVGNRNMTPAEVLEQHNEALRRSQEATEKFNSIVPESAQIDTSQIQAGQLQKGEKAAWEVTDIPDLAKEDFGITAPDEDVQYNKYTDIVPQ